MNLFSHVASKQTVVLCVWLPPTLFRSNVADELHLATPEIKGVQDGVRVSRGGLGEDVLEGALLSTQTSNAVVPYPDQDRPVEQHEEVAVPDNQCQQEREEGQSDSRRHHRSLYKNKHSPFNNCWHKNPLSEI